MNKLKIGVFLNENFNPTIGGGFSYYERLIEMIDLYEFDNKIEVCYLSKTSFSKGVDAKKSTLTLPYSELNKKNWSLKNKILNKVFSIGIFNIFGIYKKIRNKAQNNINKGIIDFLLLNKIDLIYYPASNLYPLNYPFIATHWDLGHKTMFNFPEVVFQNKYEKRENYHRITLQKAFVIFAESEQSKKELIEFEGINEERIFVVPLFPGKVIELDINQVEQTNILNKWQVEKHKFYFYPAQFWAHKNHFGLLQAFKIVLEKQPNFKLVLSGSDKGNLKYIKQIVLELGLNNNVVFTGFVSDEEIFSFYKNAISLVMPTFLGPTNMPLLEAYYLGCPVLCSNLKGHQEQMKDKAIYFDPKNYHDIATKMIEVIDFEKSNHILKENINIAQILNQHFMSLYNIRKTFGYEC